MDCLLRPGKHFSISAVPVQGGGGQRGFSVVVIYWCPKAVWSMKGAMDKFTVLSKLQKNERELRAAGIVHLRLHGSVARGQASDASDVDLIADFDSTMRLSLIDMAGLENYLADLLGAPVDLSPATALKEHVRQKAASEAVLAF